MEGCFSGWRSVPNDVSRGSVPSCLLFAMELYHIETGTSAQLIHANQDIYLSLPHLIVLAQISQNPFYPVPVQIWSKHCHYIPLYCSMYPPLTVEKKLSLRSYLNLCDQL